MKLYHHKTSGGAEYLMDTYFDWEHEGKSGKEGVINDETKYIVRIDGDITKDAELTVKTAKKELSKKEKMLEFCKKKNIDLDTHCEYEDIAHASNELEEEFGLSVALEPRQDHSDTWLQAEVYLSKIGHTLIIDYSVPDLSSIEELVDTLLEQEAKWIAIKEKYPYLIN